MADLIGGVKNLSSAAIGGLEKAVQGHDERFAELERRIAELEKRNGAK